MAGNKAGAQKAKQSEIDRYVAELGMSLDDATEHYRNIRRRIASKGGKNGDPTKRGFAANRELARLAGTIGKRGKKNEI